MAAMAPEQLEGSLESIIMRERLDITLSSDTAEAALWRETTPYQDHRIPKTNVVVTDSSSDEDNNSTALTPSAGMTSSASPTDPTLQPRDVSPAAGMAADGWILLPFLLSGINNKEQRIATFETWRLMITSDLMADFRARQSQIRKMDLEDTLRRMTADGTPLADMLDEVLIEERDISDKEALTLVFETIRSFTQEELEFAERWHKKVDNEDKEDVDVQELSSTDDDAEHGTCISAEHRSQDTTKKVIKAMELPEGVAVSTAEVIELQLNEEKVNGQVRVDPHVHEGQSNPISGKLSVEQQVEKLILTMRIAREAGEAAIIKSEALAKRDTGKATSQESTADIQLVASSPIIDPIDAVVEDTEQKTASPLSNPSLSVTLERSETKTEIEFDVDSKNKDTPPTPKKHDEAKSVPPPSVDIAEEIESWDNEHVVSDAISPPEISFDLDEMFEIIDSKDNAFFIEGVRGYREYLSEPPAPKENLVEPPAPKEKIMMRVVIEGFEDPAPSAPEESIETPPTSDTINTLMGSSENNGRLECFHHECNRTCQAFRFLLLTMEKLGQPPNDFCRLLSQNIGLLVASSMQGDTDLSKDILTSPVDKCLMMEGMGETEKCHIRAFTLGLEELFQQVSLDLQIQSAEEDPLSRAQAETNQAFLSGLKSLLDFGNTVLQNEPNADASHDQGTSMQPLETDIGNLNKDESVKKKKKKNRKKKNKIQPKIDQGDGPLTRKTNERPKEARIQTSNEVATESAGPKPACNTTIDTKHILGKPLGQYLFRKTLDIIIQMAVRGVSGQVPDEAVTSLETAESISRRALKEFEQSLGEDTNKLDWSFSQLLNRYVISQIFELGPGEALREAIDDMNEIVQTLETALESLCLKRSIFHHGLAVPDWRQETEEYILFLFKKIEVALIMLTFRLVTNKHGFQAGLGGSQRVENFQASLDNLKRHSLILCIEQLKPEPLSRLRITRSIFQAVTTTDVARTNIPQSVSILRKYVLLMMDRAIKIKEEVEVEREMPARVANTDSHTKFDFAAYLKRAFPGETWTFKKLPGDMNYIVRATRQSSGQLQRDTCILQYALPEIGANGTRYPLPYLRQNVEASALQRYGNFPIEYNGKDKADNSEVISEPGVSIPALIKVDTDEHVIIKHDLGPLVALSTAFEFFAESPMELKVFSESQVAPLFHDIGIQLGSFFAEVLHEPLSKTNYRNIYDSKLFTPHPMRELIRSTTILTIESYLEEFGAADSHELSQRVVEDFDAQFKDDFECFAFGGACLDNVLVSWPLVINGRIGLVNWELSGPGRGINGDMAQILADFQRYTVPTQEFRPLKWAVDGFLGSFLMSYRLASRSRGSTLVARRDQMPQDFGPRKRRLPPRVTRVLRSAFIAHGSELIRQAWVFRADVDMAGRVKSLAEVGIWFLRMAGRSEDELQGKNWTKIVNAECAKMILALVFDGVYPDVAMV